MAGATLTTLSNILKDYYLPPVNEQLNNEVLMLQRLESRDQELFGNQAVVPLHKTRSGGIGPAPESGALPSAGNQGYAKAVYDLKYLYGRVRVTGPSMAKTASQAGAFLQALQSELDGIRNDLRKDLARQTYADGSGKIAQCGTTTAANDVVLASDEALRKGHIHIGMVVDIGTSGDADAIAASRNVTDINIASKTVTIDGAAVTTSGSHYISRAGARSASDGTSYEVLGLGGIVATAANSVGGIDASAAGNSYWDNLRDTTGGALSLDTLSQAFNRVRIAGGEASIMVTSYGLQRAFYNLLQSQVRFTEPTNLKGGFQSLSFMDRPLVADIDAPFGKIYLLSEKYLKVFSPRDWHFLDEDGHILKWVVGYDAWEAVLAKYLNLGATRRNVQMVISGLTDTTGY